MYWRLTLSLLILPCLAVLRLHPSTSHLTTPNPLIQNHVSYWWFSALVPQWWWDYCRISHQVRGFVGSASCCIVVCVFICLFRHEAHVNSSHRQWLASILSLFQSVWVQIQPVPQQELNSQNALPTYICREAQAFLMSYSLLNVSTGSLVLLISISNVSYFKCSFKIFYLLFYMFETPSSQAINIRTTN